MDNLTPVAGLSVDDPAPITQQPITLSVSPEDQQPDISHDTAVDRANMFHYALDDKSPGPAKLYDTIKGGGEDVERKKTAMDQKIKAQSVRNGVIQDIIDGKAPGLDGSDITNVMRIADEDMPNPKAVMEKLYARRLTNDVITQALPKDEDRPYDTEGMPAIGQSVWDKEFAANPEKAHTAADAFENIVAQNKIDQAILDKLVMKYKGQSWQDFSANFFESTIPGVAWYKEHNLLPGSEEHTDSIFPGSNFEDQRNWLKSLPADQYERVLTAGIDHLAEKNITAAISFMSRIKSFNSNEKFLGNLMGGLDLATFGISAVTGTLKAARLGVTLAAIAKAANLRKAVSVPEILDAAGNVEKAAHAKVLEDVQGRAAVTGNDINDLTRNTQSITNPEQVMTGADQFLTAEQTLRLETELTKNATDLMDVSVSGPVTADRLTRGSEALTTAIEAARKKFVYLYNRANDSIIDVRSVSAHDSYNVDAAEILIGQRTGTKVAVQGAKKTKKAKGTTDIEVTVGTTQAELFKNPIAADRYAVEDLGLPKGSFSVVAHGDGHAIKYIIPVDETLPTVRNALLKPTNALTPRGLKNAVANFLRSPDEKFGVDIVKELKSIYGQSLIIGTMKRVMKNVGRLSGKEFDEWNLFTTRQQGMKNTINDSRGVFNKSVGAFGQDWFDQFGKLPTYKQTRAYFAYQQVSDINYMNYNLGLWTQKTRKGIMNFELPYEVEKATQFNQDAGKATYNTPKVEGRVLDRIPWEAQKNEPTAGIVIWDKDPSKITRIPFKLAKKGEIEKMMKEKGLVAINMTETGEKALRETTALKDVLPQGNMSIILTKKHNASPLDLMQVPYKPGGHVEYPNGYFIRQPNIVISGASKDKKGRVIPTDPNAVREDRISTYYGDKNLRMFSTPKEAQKYLGRYETARKLLIEAKTLRKNKLTAGQAAVKEAELDNYLAANLPHTRAQFGNMFKQTTKDKESGVFDLYTEFYHAHINDSVDKVAKDSFGNTGLARLQKPDGTGPRYPNFRKEQDSVFNLYKGLDTGMGMEKSEAIMTINDVGSVSKPAYTMTPARTLDPYVSMDQAAAYLLRGKYLNDMKVRLSEQFIQEFGHLFPGVTKEEQGRDPINWLINKELPTGEGPEYHAAVDFQRTAREFFNVKDDVTKQRQWFRRKMLEGVMGIDEKAGIALEPWLMHRLQDVPTFMRSSAFHLKMLAPHQLMMQLSSVLHASSIMGPKEAITGTMLSSYYRSLMMTDNPAIRAAMGAKVEEMWGMKADHFLESFEGMRRSGFNYVGKEHGQLSDSFDVGNIVGSAGTTAANAARWFFNEGERIARLSSWAMAYREWRAANPAIKFDNAAIKDVRYKADILTGNMSSQSNAAWQKGWPGVATQFWGYPVRVTEQFLGKRLSPAEKSRMFWTYGALYGVPQMGNLAMPILPLTDWSRSAFLSMNINPDTDGGPIGNIAFNGLPSFIIEQATGQKYNFSQRYGLGMSLLKDLMDGQKTWVDALGGAGGVSLLKVVKDLEPMGLSIISMFDPHSEVYPVTWDDWNNLLMNQSGYASFRRWWEAYNLGMYITKSGTNAGPYTPSEAAMGVFSGLQPQRLPDTFMMSADDEQIRKAKREASAEIIDLFHKSLDESIDDATALKYRAQANHKIKANGFDAIETGSLYEQAIAGRESMVDRVWGNIRKDPARLKMFQKIMESGDYGTNK